MTPDEQTIQELNEAYIQAFLDSDVTWYQEHLGEDFTFTDARGQVMDKETYLRLTREGTEVTDYRLRDVTVRVFGDVALVSALGVYTRAGGTNGANRYTDVYARRNGRWLAVSAQVTPVAAALAPV